MLLHKFIKRHRAQYDSYELLADLSPKQRREALKAALSLWSKDVSARTNRHGKMLIKQGSREGILPIDYLSMDYQNFMSSWPGVSSNLSKGEISTSTNRISNSYFSRGSALSTNFPPGYDTSYPLTEVPTTTTDRGRYAIDLGVLANSSSQIDIVYDAIHQIEDNGMLITINELPTSGDSFTINSKSYSFGDGLDEIEIANDTYSMAETLANLFELDQEETKVEAIADGNNVILRPSELGTKIILTLDQNKLTSSNLPALSTIPSDDEWKIFQLMMFFICQDKERQATQEENIKVAEAFEKQKNSHMKTVKPYLHLGR